MHLNPALELVISICLMSVTILAGWRVVLGTKPLPLVQSVTIATVANLFGKLFVSVWYLPATLSYSLPTLSFFILSYLFFKPTFPKLIAYWLVGFAAYLIIHVLISSAFGWTFMFPFWKAKLF
jgi:hypothetical protein